MERLIQSSATQQATLIRRREISSEELVRAHLQQVSRVNPKLNAAVDVLADRALEQARRADDVWARGRADGPLHGVPFSIKASIEQEGPACTAGTWGRRGAAPSREDAAVVKRLRAAGAIPIARTNLPDLLFAFESDNLLFGQTKNPYDLTRTSGGSSGGEAALIAACGSPCGLGSDAAGSVRVPAAFCGITSIKPTSGRLPRTGHFPPAGGWIEMLWQIGPMARYVEDLCTMMPLLIGGDGRDPSVINMPLGEPGQVALRDLRVAFYTENGYVDSLRQYLRHLGSDRVHPLLIGWLDKLEPYRVNHNGFAGYWAELDRYRAEMFAFVQHYDVILCPVYTQPALPHGASILEENFRGFSHTMAYNVAGWPAAVVRCGESPDGLPIAVQVVARPYREDVVLAVCLRLEQVFGGWTASSALFE